MSEIGEKRRTVVAGQTCGSYKTWTDYGYEYDCEYGSDISCEDCVFVEGYLSSDYRKGKKPWAKCNG